MLALKWAEMQGWAKAHWSDFSRGKISNAPCPRTLCCAARFCRPYRLIASRVMERNGKLLYPRLREEMEALHRPGDRILTDFGYLPRQAA